MQVTQELRAYSKSMLRVIVTEIWRNKKKSVFSSARIKGHSNFSTLNNQIIREQIVILPFAHYCSYSHNFLKTEVSSSCLRLSPTLPTENNKKCLKMSKL